MALLDRVLLRGGLERARRLLSEMTTPSGLAGDEWEAIQRGLNRGNEELAQAMSHGSPSSNWEWGGRVNPSRTTQTVTSGNASEVGIPKLTDADPMNGFVYHSHPVTLVDRHGGEFPDAMLSLGDLSMLTGRKTRGVMAIDPSGGIGLGVGNMRAPALENSTLGLAAEDAVFAAHPHLPGYENYWPRRVVDMPTRPDRLNENVLSPTIGMGRALKNTGVLEHYSLQPGTEAQAARLAEYEPAIEAATSAAEDVLRRWLRNNGYPDGQVRAIIGSLIASGSLVAVASNIANREEVGAA